ncbi:MAG TPA: hypothetical protein VKP58_11240 [Candidatus Acidoferrum sp.]|nr:hypothetical protein [Candidatus Acidoferrum sp.]
MKTALTQKLHLLIRGIAVTLLLVLVGQMRVQSQEVSKGGIDNREAAVKFCRSLQRAVKAKKKTRIAAWLNSYPIEVEYTPTLYPTGHRGEVQSTLIADEEEFIEKFDMIFNFDVERELSSNTACELKDKPNGSATIANGKIEIDQIDSGPTIILHISPPADYEKFYEDKSTSELGAKNFLIELRQAVADDDRKKVARLCRYPLIVNFPGNRIQLKNRKELIEKYGEVFTPEVKRVLTQQKSPITMGWRGFMTERGEIWFDHVVGTDVFRVGTINVP